jgi:catechol 2,3-dioxygenase-like lactoylglutathione lyase family enzyme
MKRPDHVCKSVLLAGVILLHTASAYAELPAPNATGVSTGHVHFNVPDAARHAELWAQLGAKVISSGPLRILGFPGMYILLTEKAPELPSSDTSANHIALAVKSYPDMRAKLVSVGANLFVDNAESGQIIADLPDGVRLEILQDDNLENPVEFHHIHLVAVDQEAVRDWYVETFGAEVSSRRNMPSAVVPGGRVDVMGARNGAPKPTRGAAIDHIGFEVADMDAFAQRLREQGKKFDVEPGEIPGAGIKLAFLTDPIGTYIEITQGLVDLE